MIHYLKLIRPYGILFLGFTPVFGAIANGEFGFPHLSLLLVIGSLAHIFAFVQNDYFDVELDKKSKYVSERPLASGSISKKMALLLFSSCFLLSLLFAALFFNLYSLIVLSLSFLLVTIYNKYSKRFPGMEYVLGAGIFMYGIFGALTVSNIPTLAIIISFTGFMQWIFSVGISANLKDVEFDSKEGARTTPIILGVRVIQNKLLIPKSFFLYTFGIKGLHIFIISLPFLLGHTSIFLMNTPIPGFSFLFVSVIIFYITWKILSSYERDTLLRYEGLQEGLALLLIPISLTSYIVGQVGIMPFLLIILLLIFWPILCLRMLFGKRMIPLE